MSGALPFAGEKRFRFWQQGPAALGQEVPSSIERGQPGETLERDAGGMVILWTGRLDNRNDLCEALAIPHDRRAQLPDRAVVLAAYQKWGEDVPKRIYGDWAFAVWHPNERKLFLARDHHGNTALYYQATPQVFAFATWRKSLLTLELAPRELDELRLAQLLLALPPDDGGRTFEKNLSRLPPAHALTVTPEQLQLRRYWYLEQVPEIHLPRREDYVEAFRELFDEAVRCRLPSDSRVAVSLSGGLDSGSVAATAAEFLRREGKRLLAFTSVPLSDTSPSDGDNFGNELPFAQATACHAGNVDLVPIAAENTGILGSIREALRLLDEPAHAASNLYWMQDILRAAQAEGCRTLLNGQFGNGTISWTGYVSSHPWRTQWHLLGWRRWLREMVRSLVPRSLLFRYRLYTASRREDAWHKWSAIHPAFAKRLHLFDPSVYGWYLQKKPGSPRDERYQYLKPGLSPVGAIYADWTVATGVETFDPTVDVRVLEFSLGVPDRVFSDPRTGLDRLLIRDAMVRRLPDSVRLNRRRGRQAGDLIPRLRTETKEFKESLNQLAHGLGGEYVDVAYLRQVWEMVHCHDSTETYRKAANVLTRGIMAGLFINHFRQKA